MQSKDKAPICTKKYNEETNDEEDTKCEEEKIRKSQGQKLEKEIKNEEIEDNESRLKKGELRREFLTRDQWEEEVELYRAYLLDLSDGKVPDIYRLTSEITTSGTLTFRIFKEGEKKYFFESKLMFNDAFLLFGYTPQKHFKSLTGLYTKVVEFLIQDMKFKLKEPIHEKSEKAIIHFINDRIKPKRACRFELKKIYVKEKNIEENIKTYMAEIDRKLTALKTQNRIFFEMYNGPKQNSHLYNFFKEPEEIRRENEIIYRKQMELEAERKKKEEIERAKSPLQKLNDKLKTNITIDEKKITLQKEYFNNDIFILLSKVNFTNLEVLEISCNFITDLKGLVEPGFKNLKVMYLHTKIKDISFFEKVQFNHLEDLSLIGNSFSSVDSLAKAPFVGSIKKLDLYKNGIRSIEGFNKANFDNLKILVLSNNNLKNIDNIKKDTFKNLEDIKLEENELLNINGLENFNDHFFEKVKLFNLNSNKIEKIDVLAKFEFALLQILNLNNNKLIDIEFLAKMKSPNLSELFLNHNCLKSFEPLSRAKFPELKVLQITDNPKVNEFDFLDKLPFMKLEKLYCCGYLGLKNIDFLSKNIYDNLKYLSLTRNKIKNIDVFEKCKFSKLKYLSMEENVITNINVLSKVCFKDLEELYLDRNKIDNIQVLEKVPFVNIKRINFMQNNFTKIGCIGNLKFNNIKSLYLQGGKVDLYDEGNNIAKENFKRKYPDCSLYIAK